MAIDGWVAVRTFVNAMEAEIARSALEAAGVEAVIHRDDAGGVEPSLWVGGVQLLVPEKDEAQAAELLDTEAEEPSS